MMPASSLTCGVLPPIGIVTKLKPAFWPFATRSTFNRSSFGFCWTVRTALNRSGEGFAPGNSLSSILSFHVPEKFGFDCANGMNAIARQTSAVLMLIGFSMAAAGEDAWSPFRNLDGIVNAGVYGRL